MYIIKEKPFLHQVSPVQKVIETLKGVRTNSRSRQYCCCIISDYFFPMWYEILPGFGIICGCVVASGLAIKTIDKLFHGKVGKALVGRSAL